MPREMGNSTKDTMSNSQQGCHCCLNDVGVDSIAWILHKGLNLPKKGTEVEATVQVSGARQGSHLVATSACSGLWGPCAKSTLQPAEVRPFRPTGL